MGELNLSLANEQISGGTGGGSSHHWFFYWKTASSLWEQKLKDQHYGSTVYVPLNWSFHSENGKQVDFGQSRPESDLEKLTNIVEDLGKEIIFFLPLGPMPFLANGGVPTLLARTLSVSFDGLQLAFCDSEQKVNSVYSYFDTRIFQGFRQFSYALNAYFEEKKLKSKVAGLYAGAFYEQEYFSYHEDVSNSFQSGLVRYLKTNNSAQGSFESFANAEEEVGASLDYFTLISELYLETAKEYLADYWVGSCDACLLGGGPTDLIKRSCASWEHPARYSRHITWALTHNKIPITALLTEQVQTKGFNQFYDMAVSSNKIENYFNHHCFEDDSSYGYSNLFFYDLFEPSHRYTSKTHAWKDLGLLEYFNHICPYNYSVSQNINVLSEADFYSDRVQFIFAKDLKDGNLSPVLKAFLNGMSLVVDLSDISLENHKRVESFILENSLETEEIQFIVGLRHISLGQGRLILFDGTDLKDQSSEAKIDFWTKILSIFEFKNQKIEVEEPVEYFWLKRTPSGQELSFEEIRRVIFYNPSSYKRKVKINLNNQHKLLRAINEFNVQVKIESPNVEITMLPDGCFALDFGFFDE